MKKHAYDVVTPDRFRLADIDLSQRAKRKTYEANLKDLQYALQRVQQAYLRTKDKAIIVFEGWDAAGKGGTIRRLSAAMDPRSFKVWPIGAPRPYYKRRHYLHRFWERLPPEGANGPLVARAGQQYDVSSAARAPECELGPHEQRVDIGRGGPRHGSRL